jgi:hypothetical protein
MAGMAQLRCVKFDQIEIGGGVSYIPARDAIFIKDRFIMVVLDTQASLFVYWGLSKLCTALSGHLFRDRAAGPMVMCSRRPSRKRNLFI